MSTLQGTNVEQGLPISFQSNSNINGDVIDTFRRVQDNHENTAQRFLQGSAPNSADRKNGDEAASKTTFFESPYWPGQHGEFKSRGLLDSNSTQQYSANLNSKGRKGADVGEGEMMQKSLMEQFG